MAQRHRLFGSNVLEGVALHALRDRESSIFAVKTWFASDAFKVLVSQSCNICVDMFGRFMISSRLHRVLRTSKQVDEILDPEKLG